MPFDTAIRNKLQKMTASCRQILTDEFTSQLQSIYGIQPTGEIIDLASMGHVDDETYTTAAILRERIEYLAGGALAPSKSVKEAILRVIREQGFTVLNRLSALRMCEEREIVRECIRKGFNSEGFKVYSMSAGSGLGDAYHRYRTYLNCIFDEISIDLGILFDRFSPFGLLFPREPALLQVLTALDDIELSGIWKEDETIGWIYQYFNSKEEREKMRKDSPAPRDSRELAVRNQFFTPRYVVEFLTDNTLGRIWYEMRQGVTSISEQCRYLVRRPNEVFLAQGEDSAAAEEDEADLSQEQLLKKPCYVDYRPKKDPRDIRILDPACGSGHFLLYAFDLLETIYVEAWEDKNSPQSESTGRCLSEDFPDLNALRPEIPRLIIEHNLHGIDIDPRAVQIATLALWLRAQRSWKNFVLKPTERPRVTRSHIVTAEPMPGDKALLDEFIGSFKGESRIVGQLVRTIWEKMQLV